MHIKGDRNGTISWDACKETVVRYRDYVRDQVWIDAVFTKHDADASGELEEAELLPLLQELAPDANVTYGDVKYVLAECDTDNNGSVSRDELLPMVGAWRSLVTDKERKEIVERTTRLWQAGQAGGAAVQAFGAKLKERRSTMQKAAGDLLNPSNADAPDKSKAAIKLNSKLRLATAMVQVGKSDRMSIEVGAPTPASPGGGAHAAAVAVVPGAEASPPAPASSATPAAVASPRNGVSTPGAPEKKGSSACLIL